MSPDPVVNVGDPIIQVCLDISSQTGVELPLVSVVLFQRPVYRHAVAAEEHFRRVDDELVGVQGRPALKHPPALVARVLAMLCPQVVRLVMHVRKLGTALLADNPYLLGGMVAGPKRRCRPVSIMILLIHDANKSFCDLFQ